jgi:hypothetical protein
MEYLVRSACASWHTVATASELATKINAAGAAFGFTQESACGQVFG